MSPKVALLADRAVVRVEGADARTFLNGLITNDVAHLSAPLGVFAGLLTPQGKILFDFFVTPSTAADDALLVDVSAAKAAEFAKRLALYKLRAKIEIHDDSSHWDVWATIGPDDGIDPWIPDNVPGAGTIAQLELSFLRAVTFTDQRHPAIGRRWLVPRAARTQLERLLSGRLASAEDYQRHRIACAVPEGGKDYTYGDAYPHEANFDLTNGVSFTKGCYVGQEIVARMQNKSVVRKRVVKIAGDAPLTSGSDICVGDVPIGTVGSVDGPHALAMLRLDRAAEANDQGRTLTASTIMVTPDPEALRRYRAAAAARLPAQG